MHFLTHPPTHHLLPSGTPPLADGSLEDFDESGAGSGGNKKESPEDAAARAKLEAARARESVRWVRGAEEGDCEESPCTKKTVWEASRCVRLI